MPVKIHHTSEGWYYRWGEHGKKYFFDPDNPAAKSAAEIWQCARVVQPLLMDTGGNKHSCKGRTLCG